MKYQQTTFETDFQRFGPEMKSKVIVEREILSRLGERGRFIVPEQCHNSNLYLVTDTIVDKLYGEKVLFGLRDAGLSVEKIVVPADSMDESGESSGEKYKTLEIFSNCVDEILAKGIDKYSCIISLGGGVVNNLCGFIASCLYRGITLVHITTTMMGQSDAAIDFKQAVNHPLGKNLIGAYHPASIIVCDPCTLQSLSSRHLLNGLSECLKHAFTQSDEFLRFMVDNIDNLREVDYLEEVIQRTTSMKAPTLTHYHATNFNEMCPQYGHALGHAVEHLSWTKGNSPSNSNSNSPNDKQDKTEGSSSSYIYGPPLLHGEACAIGMCITAEIALVLGLCTQAVVDRHYEVFRRVGLPRFVPRNMPIDLVLKKMVYDKHFVSSCPTMGVLVEVGNMHCKNLHQDSDTHTQVKDPADTIVASSREGEGEGGGEGTGVRGGDYALKIQPDVLSAAIDAHIARRERVLGKEKENKNEKVTEKDGSSYVNNESEEASSIEGETSENENEASDSFSSSSSSSSAEPSSFHEKSRKLLFRYRSLCGTDNDSSNCLSAAASEDSETDSDTESTTLAANSSSSENENENDSDSDSISMSTLVALPNQWKVWTKANDSEEMRRLENASWRVWSSHCVNTSNNDNDQ